MHQHASAPVAISSLAQLQSSADYDDAFVDPSLSGRQACHDSIMAACRQRGRRFAGSHSRPNLSVQRTWRPVRCHSLLLARASSSFVDLDLKGYRQQTTNVIPTGCTRNGFELDVSDRLQKRRECEQTVVLCLASPRRGSRDGVDIFAAPDPELRIE